MTTQRTTSVNLTLNEISTILYNLEIGTGELDEIFRKLETASEKLPLEGGGGI